jgi:hypothetical protein
MTQQAQPACRNPPPTRRIVQGLLSLLLVVAIFYYLLRGIDLATVWAEIQALTWLELATLVAIAGWNLCTYAWVWMSVTPGLSFWRAMGMTQATTAVANTIPAGVGAAIGIGMIYTMLGSWGYSRSRTTTAVLVSGVWNSFIKLGLPVLALALVALQGGATGGRVVAALLGIAGLAAAVVVFALMLRSEEVARRFGLLAGRVATRLLGLVRRPPVAGWELATVKFRTRTIGLVQRRWVAITVTSLVSHLSLWGTPEGVQHALLVRQWSPDVTLFPHTDTLTPEQREHLTARGIGIVGGAVARLVVDNDQLHGIELGGGFVVPRTAVFVRPRFVPNTELLIGLGCAVDEHGWVVPDQVGRTSVAGVWVAGNAADPRAQVISAAGEGSAAAIALNADLVDEDLQRALADHRAGHTTQPPRQRIPLHRPEQYAEYQGAHVTRAQQ